METGINEIPFVTPPDQVYDAAPVPLRLTTVPGQTVDEGEIVEPTVGV